MSINSISWSNIETQFYQKCDKYFLHSSRKIAFGLNGVIADEGTDLYKELLLLDALVSHLNISELSNPVKSATLRSRTDEQIFDQNSVLVQCVRDNVVVSDTIDATNETIQTVDDEITKSHIVRDADNSTGAVRTIRVTNIPNYWQTSSALLKLVNDKINVTTTSAHHNDIANNSASSNAQCLKALNELLSCELFRGVELSDIVLRYVVDIIVNDSSQTSGIVPMTTNSDTEHTVSLDVSSNIQLESTKPVIASAVVTSTGDTTRTELDGSDVVTPVTSSSVVVEALTPLQKIQIAKAIHERGGGGEMKLAHIQTSNGSSEKLSSTEDCTEASPRIGRSTRNTAVSYSATKQRKHNDSTTASQSNNSDSNQNSTANGDNSDDELQKMFTKDTKLPSSVYSYENLGFEVCDDSASEASRAESPTRKNKSASSSSSTKRHRSADSHKKQQVVASKRTAPYPTSALASTFPYGFEGLLGKSSSSSFKSSAVTQQHPVNPTVSTSEQPIIPPSTQNVDTIGKDDLIDPVAFSAESSTTTATTTAEVSGTAPVSIQNNDVQTGCGPYLANPPQLPWMSPLSQQPVLSPQNWSAQQQQHQWDMLNNFTQSVNQQAAFSIPLHIPYGNHSSPYHQLPPTFQLQPRIPYGNHGSVYHQRQPSFQMQPFMPFPQTSQSSQPMNFGNWQEMQNQFPLNSLVSSPPFPSNVNAPANNPLRDRVLELNNSLNNLANSGSTAHSGLLSTNGSNDNSALIGNTLGLCNSIQSQLVWPVDTETEMHRETNQPAVQSPEGVVMDVPSNRTSPGIGDNPLAALASIADGMLGFVDTQSFHPNNNRFASSRDNYIPTEYDDHNGYDGIVDGVGASLFRQQSPISHISIPQKKKGKSFTAAERKAYVAAGGVVAPRGRPRKTPLQTLPGGVSSQSQSSGVNNSSQPVQEYNNTLHENRLLAAAVRKLLEKGSSGNATSSTSPANPDDEDDQLDNAREMMTTATATAESNGRHTRGTRGARTKHYSVDDPFVYYAKGSNKSNSRRDSGGADESGRLVKKNKTPNDDRLSKSQMEHILSSRPEETHATRMATVNEMLARRAKLLRPVHNFPVTALAVPDVTACLNLRHGLIKGDWCLPGRVVGFYADGIGEPSLSAMAIGVVLDDYVPSGMIPAPPKIMDVANLTNSVVDLTTENALLGGRLSGDIDEYQILDPDVMDVDLHCGYRHKSLSMGSLASIVSSDDEDAESMLPTTHIPLNSSAIDTPLNSCKVLTDADDILATSQSLPAAATTVAPAVDSSSESTIPTLFSSADQQADIRAQRRAELISSYGTSIKRVTVKKVETDITHQQLPADDVDSDSSYEEETAEEKGLRKRRKSEVPRTTQTAGEQLTGEVPDNNGVGIPAPKATSVNTGNANSFAILTRPPISTFQLDLDSKEGLLQLVRDAVAIQERQNAETGQNVPFVQTERGEVLMELCDFTVEDMENAIASDPTLPTSMLTVPEAATKAIDPVVTSLPASRDKLSLTYSGKKRGRKPVSKGPQHIMPSKEFEYYNTSDESDVEDDKERLLHRKMDVDKSVQQQVVMPTTTDADVDAVAVPEKRKRGRPKKQPLIHASTGMFKTDHTSPHNITHAHNNQFTSFHSDDDLNALKSSSFTLLHSKSALRNKRQDDTSDAAVDGTVFKSHDHTQSEQGGSGESSSSGAIKLLEQQELSVHVDKKTAIEDITTIPLNYNELADRVLISFGGEIPIALSDSSDLAAFESGWEDDYIVLDKEGHVRLFSSLVANATNSSLEEEDEDDEVTVDKILLDLYNPDNYRVIGLAKRRGTAFKPREQVISSSSNGVNCVTEVTTEPVSHIIRMKNSASYSVDFRLVSEDMKIVTHPDTMNSNSNNSGGDDVTGERVPSHWQQTKLSALDTRFVSTLKDSILRDTYTFTNINGNDCAASDLEEFVKCQSIKVLLPAVNEYPCESSDDEETDEIKEQKIDKFDKYVESVRHTAESKATSALINLFPTSERTNDVDVEICEVKGVRVVMSSQIDNHALWQSYHQLLEQYETKIQEKFDYLKAQQLHQQKMLAHQRKMFDKQAAILNELISQNEQSQQTSNQSSGQQQTPTIPPGRTNLSRMDSAEMERQFLDSINLGVESSSNQSNFASLLFAVEAASDVMTDMSDLFPQSSSALTRGETTVSKNRNSRSNKRGRPTDRDSQDISASVGSKRSTPSTLQSENDVPRSPSSSSRNRRFSEVIVGERTSSRLGGNSNNDSNKKARKSVTFGVSSAMLLPASSSSSDDEDEEENVTETETCGLSEAEIAKRAAAKEKADTIRLERAKARRERYIMEKEALAAKKAAAALRAQTPKAPPPTPVSNRKPLLDRNAALKEGSESSGVEDDSSKPRSRRSSVGSSDGQSPNKGAKTPSKTVTKTPQRTPHESDSSDEEERVERTTRSSRSVTNTPTTTPSRELSGASREIRSLFSNESASSRSYRQREEEKAKKAEEERLQKTKERKERYLASKETTAKTASENATKSTPTRSGSTASTSNSKKQLTKSITPVPLVGQKRLRSNSVVTSSSSSESSSESSSSDESIVKKPEPPKHSRAPASAASAAPMFTSGSYQPTAAEITRMNIEALKAAFGKPSTNKKPRDKVTEPREKVTEAEVEKTKPSVPPSSKVVTTSSTNAVSKSNSAATSTSRTNTFSSYNFSPPQKPVPTTSTKSNASVVTANTTREPSLAELNTAALKLALTVDKKSTTAAKSSISSKTSVAVTTQSFSRSNNDKISKKVSENNLKSNAGSTSNVKKVSKDDSADQKLTTTSMNKSSDKNVAKKRRSASFDDLHLLLADDTPRIRHAPVPLNIGSHAGTTYGSSHISSSASAAVKPIVKSVAPFVKISAPIAVAAKNTVRKIEQSNQHSSSVTSNRNLKDSSSSSSGSNPAAKNGVSTDATSSKTIVPKAVPKESVETQKTVTNTKKSSADSSVPPPAADLGISDSGRIRKAIVALNIGNTKGRTYGEAETVVPSVSMLNTNTKPTEEVSVDANKSRTVILAELPTIWRNRRRVETAEEREERLTLRRAAYKASREALLAKAKPKLSEVELQEEREERLRLRRLKYHTARGTLETYLAQLENGGSVGTAGSVTSSEVEEKESPKNSTRLRGELYHSSKAVSTLATTATATTTTSQSSTKGLQKTSSAVREEATTERLARSKSVADSASSSSSSSNNVKDESVRVTRLKELNVTASSAKESASVSTSRANSTKLTNVTVAKKDSGEVSRVAPKQMLLSHIGKKVAVPSKATSSSTSSTAAVKHTALTATTAMTKNTASATISTKSATSMTSSKSSIHNNVSKAAVSSASVSSSAHEKKQQGATSSSNKNLEHKNHNLRPFSQSNAMTTPKDAAHVPHKIRARRCSVCGRHSAYFCIQCSSEKQGYFVAICNPFNESKHKCYWKHIQ